MPACVCFRPIADISGEEIDAPMRATALLYLAAALLLSGCEDMFSLTPNKEVGSFIVQAGLPETDAAVELVAQRQGLQVHRDPKPRERNIPRDYLATVGRGRCLLMVEGRGNSPEATIEVTLGVAEGSACDERMRAIFNDLRAELQG